MSVPLLRPGQTHEAVPRMKKALVAELIALGLQPVAVLVRVDTTKYGDASVGAVRKLQETKGLKVDGVVGKDTWHALGIDEPVVDENPGGQALHVGVIMAPNANKPGQAMQPMILDYVARMAAMLGKPITVTCGTNHNKMTANGKVSDHFSGHAADIGMAANGGTLNGPVGDRIMEIALLLAGHSAADAHAKATAGGLYNTTQGNQRIQCIWKTDIGGDHHDHVHVGVRPA